MDTYNENSVKIIPTELYPVGILKTTDPQQKAIDRHACIPYFSKTRYKITSVPEHLLIAAQRETHLSSWRVEAKHNEKDLKNCAITTGISGANEDSLLSETSDRVGHSIFCQEIPSFFYSELSSWIEQPVLLSNSFGPRKYHKGSVLVNHIDRYPTHIISVSLLLDQKIDKPWALTLQFPSEIVEVYLEPGQALFYEGCRTPHARPYPLEGDWYINMYAHYRPMVYATIGAPQIP